jgi:bifunctional ADP-heptose synthase (sugar kinase/adenylyltransferase)
VTGAGDTVAAVFSIATALNADAIEAAILGNLAASLVVKKAGTATVSKEELLNLINDL